MTLLAWSGLGRGPGGHVSSQVSVAGLGDQGTDGTLESGPFPSV